MLLCVQFKGTIGAEGLTFKLLERRLNNNFEPYKGKDSNIFRGQHLCMMSMSRFVRQTFAHIHKHKGAPNSKISCDWMRKAASETCTSRFYELAPPPSLFVRPITAILGKVPMVRATIPFSMRRHERAYSSIQEEGVIRQSVAETAVNHDFNFSREWQKPATKIASVTV